MANSETGTSTGNTFGGEYQVFLSFRGPDTRRGFTNVLYHDLRDVGIHVFVDDEELRPGERISGNLLRAIDDSRLYIPILSPNYALSHWCLREVAKMVENTSEFREDGNEKVILPIFYNVQPDDVKLRTSLYSNNILNLEQMMEIQKKKFSSEDVETWRAALRRVGGIIGFDLQNYTGDGDLSKSVVEEVVNRLQTRQRKVTKDLVGMEDRIAAINNLLGINYGGVRLIGIYGMGGIGKTTLAKIIYNQLCPHFGKNCSFLDDVRETAKTKGLDKLQEKLLSNISNSRAARNIGDIDFGTDMIQQTIRNKKVLIVLDDVDEGNQIQKLIGVNSLCPGTTILVTTRDKSVLNIRGFKFEDYEMVGLNDQDALQLFSRHAFDGDSPPQDYYTLSKDIVSTASGLPLALQAIGSSLFNQKNKKIWEERLEKLRKTPHKDVLGKLRISYDALDPDQQHIFLDVACFFIRKNKTNPIYMWEDCGFSSEYAIDVLIKRCMIKVLDNDNFWMHDQFRDLGRAIAKEERTRLWDRDDVTCELRSTEIKRSVQALYLRAELDNAITVTAMEIERFPNLQFLWLINVICQGDFTGCLSKLKWILLQSYNYYHKHDPQFMATNLHLENVVVMDTYGHDWTEDAVSSLIMGARKLKVLILQNCPSLHWTPTFSENSVLEKLTISGCRSLKKIDCSIGKLKLLTDLNVERCKELENLPEQIGELENLQHLSLRECHSLKELPNSVSKLGSLTKLDVSVTGIIRLPDSIGRLQSLSSLNVSSTKIVKLPGTMCELRCLQTLDLYNCRWIQELPKLPESLTTLQLRFCPLQIVPDLSNLTNLVELFLSKASNDFILSHKSQSCDLLWIERLSKLRKLELDLLNVLATSTVWGSLSLLEELSLSGLDLLTLTQLPSNLRVLSVFNTQVRLVELDGLPELEKLTIRHCEFVIRISITSTVRKLRAANVESCNKLVEVEFLGVLKSMKSLYISECHSLDRLVCLSEEPGCNELQAPNLTVPNLSNLTNLVEPLLSDVSENYIHSYKSQSCNSQWIGRLSKLREQELCLLNVSAPRIEWGSLSLLEELTLSELDLRVLELDGLPELEKLTIRSCELVTRTSITSSLRKLREANVDSCNKLVEVQFLGVLKSMKSLSITGCKSLERLVCLLEEPVCNELQSPELTDGRRRVSLISSSLKMLQELNLSGCLELQEIQFVSTLKALEESSVEDCISLKSLGGLSNLKNLRTLNIVQCESLQDVDDIAKLEFLRLLRVCGCRSIERITDASSSKIANECWIDIVRCRRGSDPWDGFLSCTVGDYRKMTPNEPIAP